MLKESTKRSYSQQHSDKQPTETKYSGDKGTVRSARASSHLVQRPVGDGGHEERSRWLRRGANYCVADLAVEHFGRARRVHRAVALAVEHFGRARRVHRAAAFVVERFGRARRVRDGRSRLSRDQKEKIV